VCILYLKSTSNQYIYISLRIADAFMSFQSNSCIYSRAVHCQLSHDTIHIPIQGSRYNTYPDTGVTIQYVSRYRGHDTIRITIQWIHLCQPQHFR